MKSTKIILLIMACMSFIVVLGGGVYEHVALVPVWSQAPPASLTMFQGEYGFNAGPFWTSIHPVTLVLLLAALLANWKSTRRKYILIAIAGYALGIIVTFTYFVPELLAIIQTPYQPIVDNNLVARANTWEILSLIRMVYIVALSGVLLFSLTKNENKDRAI